MDSITVTTLDPIAPMEYKYVLVSHASGPLTAKMYDLSRPYGEDVSFKLLFARRWTPVREIPMGGGGDSTGTSILILLQRAKRNK
jgi:hypothetical protein